MPKPESILLDCLSNDFALSADWLRIPFGDHPHAQAVQRLSRASAEALANDFHGIAGRLGRLFGGVPIFVGHPDDPRLANQFPDKRSYGWIMDVEARADGLYLKPKWSAAGEELLANAHYKWFSPFWGCRDLGQSPRIVEPVRLISLGLTNTPNIQGILPLANAETRTEREVMKSKLIKSLALAEDASDEAVVAAVAALQTTIANQKTELAAAGTALANEKTARESALSNEKTAAAAREAQLQSDLSNSRKAHIELVLDNALSAGKITPAQRPQWAADLEKDLAGKLTELANAKPVLNTSSKTGGLGGRNSSVNAAAGDRRDKVLTLVNERMTKTREDYPTAFANIRRANPALFDEMTQPGKK